MSLNYFSSTIPSILLFPYSWCGKSKDSDIQILAKIESGHSETSFMLCHSIRRHTIYMNATARNLKYYLKLLHNTYAAYSRAPCGISTTTYTEINPELENLQQCVAKYPKWPICKIFLQLPHIRAPDCLGFYITYPRRD